VAPRTARTPAGEASAIRTWKVVRNARGGLPSWRASRAAARSPRRQLFLGRTEVVLPEDRVLHPDAQVPLLETEHGVVASSVLGPVHVSRAQRHRQGGPAPRGAHRALARQHQQRGARIPVVVDEDVRPHPSLLVHALGVEGEVGQVLVEDAGAHVAQHVLLDHLADLHLHLLQPPGLSGGGQQQHHRPQHRPQPDGTRATRQGVAPRRQGEQLPVLGEPASARRRASSADGAATPPGGVG
jgi:hypothetical protein